MPSQITSYKLFIASPGGLQTERQAFRRTVEEFNESTALLRSVLFQPVGWEDTLGGAGRPQEIINQELRGSDYFLMLLWDRWGSRTSTSDKDSFSSGTEEEFHIAKLCLVDKNESMRQIVVFFKAVDTRQLSDPGEELKKVISFRKELESKKEFLYHSFDDVAAFQDLLHRFLNRWLIDHEQKKGKLTAANVNLRPLSETLQPSEGALAILTGDSSSKLVAQAQDFARQGRLADAESTFATAVESGTDPQALLSYGDFLLRLGRYSQAESAYKRLLTLSDKAGDRWKAIAYSGMGRTMFRRNRLVEAEQLYRSALQLAEALDIPGVRANQLRNLGILKAQRGELKEAERNLTEAIAIYTRLENKKGLAQILNMLGEVSRQRGAFSKAEESYAESERISRALADDEELASVLNNAGWNSYQKGMFDSAEKKLREALVLNQKLNRMESIALNHRNLAFVLKQRGNHIGAKEEFRLASEIYAGLGLAQRIPEINAELAMLSD